MKHGKKGILYGKRVLAALAAAALLPGCAKRTAAPPGEAPAPVYERVPGTDYAEGKELLASVKTLEDAERLEELYGIELVEYGDGLAVFHSEEDPAAVVRRGEENGWPALEVNWLVSAFEESR